MSAVIACMHLTHTSCHLSRWPAPHPSVWSCLGQPMTGRHATHLSNTTRYSVDCQCNLMAPSVVPGHVITNSNSSGQSPSCCRQFTFPYADPGFLVVRPSAGVGRIQYIHCLVVAVMVSERGGRASAESLLLTQHLRRRLVTSCRSHLAVGRWQLDKILLTEAVKCEQYVA